MPTTEVTLYTSIQPQLKRPVRRFLCKLLAAHVYRGKESRAGFRIVSFRMRQRNWSFSLTSTDRRISTDCCGPETPDHYSFFCGSGEGLQNRVVGIINGDCLIIQQMNLVDPSFTRYRRYSHCPKTQYRSTDIQHSGRPCMGFDAFFFEPASLARIEHDSFWLLGGWWVDYWLPSRFRRRD